jgi:beta-glucosidase
MKWKLALVPLIGLAALFALPAPAQQARVPAGDPDARATALLKQMTLPEKLSLLHGHYPNKMPVRPEGVTMSAGWVPGIARLGIPDLRMTDASLGVAAAHQFDNPATALPSGLAQAASFDPRVAFAGGATIGAEARAKGFNVMLAGGANLVREPRNGRNFEYLGEDPLLAGVMGGEAVKGIQSNNIVSTTKHFALNAQETGRQVLDARMSEQDMRESDLLAFEKLIEIGDPGAIMCAYNKVDGDYACENGPLIAVPRVNWGWKGWMMSDWGAVHSTVKSAKAGLDQEMGEELDQNVWYGQMLADAVDTRLVSEDQIDAMVHRILRSLFAHGVMDNPVQQGGSPDLAAGARVTQDAGEKGIVLLKNSRNVLPLTGSVSRIAVIGGYADTGVMSGGGSSQVKPAGVQVLPPPQIRPSFIDNIYLHPSRPLDALHLAAPWATVTFNNGNDILNAVAGASSADVAIVFATQYTTEGMDNSMSLDGNADALIAAVAQANPNTIVVLETGGAVTMPWLDKVAAVVEAWYPGGRGGEAIANVLTGKVDPQGRLPVTFPYSVSQLPNPELPGSRLPRPDRSGNAQPEPFAVTYPEGADAGYRWYARRGQAPLFPFGYGLSYTSFTEDLIAFDPASLSATVRVINTGQRTGTDTPQIYITPPGGVKRLAGWVKARLAPGEAGDFAIAVDPRFLAHFDTRSGQWVMAAGTYLVEVASSATARGVAMSVDLAEVRLPVNWQPRNALSAVALTK